MGRSSRQPGDVERRPRRLRPRSAPRRRCRPHRGDRQRVTVVPKGRLEIFQIHSSVSILLACQCDQLILVVVTVLEMLFS